MRKKSNIVVQKYIDDLAETQKNIDLNNLDEENEAAREEIDRDIYNNITDKIEVQDDDKKKMSTSRCMKKMRTTPRTKTKKMKMKMEMKFIA